LGAPRIEKHSCGDVMKADALRKKIVLLPVETRSFWGNTGSRRPASHFLFWLGLFLFFSASDRRREVPVASLPLAQEYVFLRG